jgi:hypothetical protein
MPPEDAEDSQWVDSADRRIAIRALGEHRHEERLTDSEHDRRRDLAQQAQTRGELHALFTDLPAPHPLIGEPPSATPIRWYNSGAGLFLLTGSVIALAAILAGWWVPALLFGVLLVVATVLVATTR